MYRWLETYAATNTRLRTQQGYRSHIRANIVPAIGSVRLQELRPDQIQKMYSDLLARGISVTAVRVHRLLKQALSHAVKWGLLIRNPVDATTPPRGEAQELEMWDIPTLRAFLDAASGSRYGTLYHLAVLTGLRRSELLGLTWKAVDLDARSLMVLKTLQRITGHGLVEGQPKTKRSRRPIALSPEAVKVLRRIRANQLEERLVAGPAWEDTGFVFTQPNGRRVDSNFVTRDFQKIVTHAGMPHLTLKGLRHAHATVMLTKGVHPKIVSERLGHSNISTTMDIYSHVIPGLQEKAANTVDEALSADG